jgi:uncharacterized protein YfaQ (DUF2300 family)
LLAKVVGSLPAGCSPGNGHGSGSALPADGCVEVHFFARYPFRLEKAGGGAAVPGILRGRFVARFRRAAIPFSSEGEMRWDGKRLAGRFGLEEYVARVLDREADAKEVQAARALAVVVRSFLLNEAARAGSCLLIADESRKQRVSPNPPSPAARQAALFTRGLVLKGMPVGYRLEGPGPGRLAWRQAVAEARAGKRWDQILGAVFDPQGLPCPPFAAAQAWLDAQRPLWERRLSGALPGFAAPGHVQVCRLAWGVPFSEQGRMRIYLRSFRHGQGRLALAHEYLHLALAGYPAGQDEAWVEAWAEKLLASPGEPMEALPGF